MSETTKHTSGAANFTYGFITGGLIVGSLALLFAPKKGKALRKDISSAANSLSDKAGEYLNSAGEYLNTAKEKANCILKDGRDKLEKAIVSSEKLLKSKTTK